MKVFISADLEGVSGVVHGEHVMRDGREHDRARKLMTQEVNAAIEGALEAGATKIVVNDSHGTMRNIIPEELHEEAELITGSSKPLSMMQGIDSTFDAAFFIGYHAMPSNYPSILGHTYHGRVVYNLRVNKKTIGETGINAAIAGYYNVPVALVTGDEAVTKETQEILKKVITVPVKRAFGRYAAQCLSPNKARKLIKESAAKALKNLSKFEPYKINPPITFEIDFVDAGMTDMAMLIPGVKRTASRTVTYTSNDLIEAYKTFRAL
ncbi:MAG: M55 family metallopeptidase, partial [Candidatus Bathyarchaeia archaeon]